MTRTSATGPERGRRPGFTLTEVLVVTAIIGLAGAAVVLTAAPSGAEGARAEGEGFARALGRAREEALLTNRTVEVAVTAEGYSYEAVTLRGREPLEDGALRGGAWDEGVSPRLPDDQAASLRFRFDPTGLAEPETLVLQDGRRAVQVSVDESGKVALDDAPR